MKTINNVHQQCAGYFGSEKLKPFAYLLSKKLNDGHICLPLDGLADDSMLLPDEYKLNAPSFEALNDGPLVYKEGGPKQPFVMYNNRMYLQRYFHYETLILNRIKQFVADEANSYQQRLGLLIENQDFITKLVSVKKTSTVK